MPSYPAVSKQAKQHGKSGENFQRLERPTKKEENTRGLVQRIEVRT